MNIYISYLLSNILSLAKKIGFDRSKLKDPSSIISPVDERFHFMRIAKGIKNFQYIYDNGPVTGKSFLEFGTGGHGIDLQLAYILGFKELYTVDINNHLENRWLKEAKRIGKYSEKIQTIFSIPESIVRERIERISDCQSVSEFFELINCTFTPFDHFSSGFSSNGIDLWYSESNLQRIPLRKVLPYFQVAAEEMNKEALAFHRLDLGDIYHQPHYPLHAKGIGRFNFLKYNNLLWKVFNSDHYSSQNRLRFPQFLNTFEGLKLKVVKWDQKTYTEDFKGLIKMNTAINYVHLTPEQRAYAHVVVLLKKDQKTHLDALQESYFANSNN